MLTRDRRIIHCVMGTLLECAAFCAATLIFIMSPYKYMCALKCGDLHFNYMVMNVLTSPLHLVRDNGEGRCALSHSPRDIIRIHSRVTLDWTQEIIHIIERLKTFHGTCSYTPPFKPSAQRLLAVH